MSSIKVVSAYKKPAQLPPRAPQPVVPIPSQVSARLRAGVSSDSIPNIQSQPQRNEGRNRSFRSLIEERGSVSVVQPVNQLIYQPVDPERTK